MNKLAEFVRETVRDELSKRQDMKRVRGVVTAVRDDYLRADVRLDGGTKVNLLNKTAEKLHEGDSVWIEYRTQIKSGHIAMRNGEADPLKEGGGGGNFKVENAAIITQSDAEELDVGGEINELLTASLNSLSRAVYGEPHNPFILDGHYCLWTTTNYSDAELQEIIREEYLTYQWKSFHRYSDQTPQYIYYFAPYQITLISSGTYQLRLAAVTKNVTTGAVTVNTSSSYLIIMNNQTELPVSVGLIPIANAYTNNNISGAYKTPYGYLTLRWYVVGVYDVDGEHELKILNSYASYPQYIYSIFPTTYGFKNEAELIYFLGMTKRTENEEDITNG